MSQHPLQLNEVKHPNPQAAALYESLVGIDSLKGALVDELVLILDRERLDRWLQNHHPDGLPYFASQPRSTPLVLLSGEVGCGKTALASSVATPVANLLDTRIVTLDTPSDIRGSGLVGELSLRITETFAQASRKAASFGRALLVIDEADDLATERSQMQAHHEDRAGVNVLIKQIDQIAKDKTPIAVILITNRADVLDPAVRRRAKLHLQFQRPDRKAREALFRRLLAGTDFAEKEIHALLSQSERDVPYSYSDLTDRVGRLAMRLAWKADRPFSTRLVLEALAQVEPSPLVLK